MLQQLKVLKISLVSNNSSNDFITLSKHTLGHHLGKLLCATFILKEVATLFIWVSSQKVTNGVLKEGCMECWVSVVQNHFGNIITNLSFSCFLL